MSRTRRTIGALALATTTAATLVLGPGPATAAPPAPVSAVPPDVVLVLSLDSLLARHDLYEQVYRGVPVLNGYYQRHVGLAGGVQVSDGRLPVADLDVTPTVARAVAVQAALARAGGTAVRDRLAVLAGSPSRLVWAVDTVDTHVLVDARSGSVVLVESLLEQATGQGRIFDPNPVVALQDESLKDEADANSAVPVAAYRSVPLLNLDASGFLRGRWAEITEAVGGLAQSSDGTFSYARNDDRFEQVNAYYGVDRAQVYFRSLGLRTVNAEPQDLLINTYSGDNSFYSPSADTITFGRGGVDDAEDLEVVWHELGHAVQDAQVPGFGRGTEAGSIGEGYGDYLALTMSSLRAPDTARVPLACIADWDATSYTSTAPHCLRRADTDKHYPEDKIGEVHADGEIWSAALYDVWQAIGRTRADTAVLEGQFSFAPDTTMPEAARNIVAAADGLYGSQVARAVFQAFQARGIL